MSLVLQGKDLICDQDWDKSELQDILNLAVEMKRNPFDARWVNSLQRKKFLLLFYNPSLRTHLSFESAVADLGGHVIYRTPEMGWVKTAGSITSSEALKDMARVVSRYVDGVGIRITMSAVSRQEESYQFLTDFARFAEVPVINMAGGGFHPCQGLADLMGWSERFSTDGDVRSLQGKTLLLTWGSSGFARPWASVQSHLLLASRFGMNIKLAHPEGYDLDPAVIEMARKNCQQNNTNFLKINNHHEGYDGTEVVYVRNWVTNQAYQNGQFQYDKEIQRANSLQEWIVTEEKMKKTNKALFANPMPVDRGKEAEDMVIDSGYSVIYDVAENRKHIQKALLAKIIGNV